jgi:hypothetical protein
VTRLVRWTKPDGELGRKMGERMRQEQLEVARRQLARKAQLQQAEAAGERDAQAKRAAEGQVRSKVAGWARGKGVVALLRTAGLVLPPGRAAIDLGAEPSGAEVRKAYLRAARALHPDRLAADVGVEERLLCTAVFAALTDAFAEFNR